MEEQQGKESCEGVPSHGESEMEPDFLPPQYEEKKKREEESGGVRMALYSRKNGALQRVQIVAADCEKTGEPLRNQCIRQELRKKGLVNKVLVAIQQM